MSCGLRSIGRFRSCGTRPRAFAQIGFEFPLDDLRMQSLNDSADAIEHQLLHTSGFLSSRLELRACRKEKDICQADPVHRRDERDRNSVSDQFNLVEMLHHLNQSENSADNAYRGSVS